MYGFYCMSAKDKYVLIHYINHYDKRLQYTYDVAFFTVKITEVIIEKCKLFAAPDGVKAQNIFLPQSTAAHIFRYRKHLYIDRHFF